MEHNWIKSNLIEDTLDSGAYQSKFTKNIMHIMESGLEIKKLDDLCKSIYRGNTPEHSEVYNKSGALLLKTVNIRSNELDLSKSFSMNYETYINQGRYKLEENDICITIMGATDDIVGRAWVYNKAIGKACFSDGIAKIEDVKIDPYYLSTYINSIYGHLSIIQWAGSSTRSYVTNKQLGSTIIPIASPEIQKYIGDKVRKAEELREEAKRLKKEAEEILSEKLNINYNIIKSHKYAWVKDTVINDRLNSEYYNEIYNETEQQLRKHNCKNLIDLCNDFSITVPYSKDFGEKSEINIIPMIRVKNIDEYNVDNSELIYMSQKYYNENEKCRVSNGDILMSRVGTIGRAGIYSYNDEASMGQNITRIKLKEEINKFYFLCYINSKTSKMLMERETNTAIQPNLTNENIKQLPIPILDYSIQQHIGEKILNYMETEVMSKQLIQEAKKDVEDLIEGNFDMSKLNQS